MKSVWRSLPWLLATALAASLVLSTACSSSDDDSEGAAPPDIGGGLSASDEPSGVTAGGESPGGDTQQAQLGRKLIRTATIEIETDAVSQKFEEITNIALTSGGFVFSSQFGNDGDEQTASITIRVPEDRYPEVLGQLRRLGDVREEHSNSTDVTEEFTDLNSSLNNLQATEREYLELMTGARNVDEILVLQDRLNGTRAQIEQVQGRLNLIVSQTDYATITAHLTPAAAPAATGDGGRPSLKEVTNEAFDASIAVLFGVAVVGIAVLAFGWFLIPLAAVGIYLGRRQMKQDRARSHAPPPAAP